MSNELTALALNCTLKPSPADSSTQKLAGEVLSELAALGVTGEQLRVVDFDVRPGVTADEGDGDQWPILRHRILGADILVFATPTWMGHPSSVAQRVLERLDAELSVTDDNGVKAMTGKVAVVAVVGNEDGAHAIVADVFQALNDVGFTIPAQGSTYWNGEAMQTVNYNQLEQTPPAVAATTHTLARNAFHLAGLLKGRPYLPAV
ncbi:flavodoxin family protein [Gryllotalpicola ginsengisoli]|uniref:flavodoxin family protein n=1 Tax=Gryllotalpicola ginsengisoli TaxID=444608 RepID=UPI0003B38C51|nr:NAD(P)H-dependent oxidoreductase [Gryllotalpicola ginsengisoli]